MCISKSPKTIVQSGHVRILGSLGMLTKENEGVAMMNRMCEDALTAILGAYDDNNSHHVSGTYDIFPEYMSFSLKEVFTKLKTADFLASFDLYLGSWSCYLTPEAITYKKSKETPLSKNRSEMSVLPSTSKELLTLILDSDNPVELLQQMFSNCSNSEQDKELRSQLRELQQERYINIPMWADDLPWYVEINSSARVFDVGEVISKPKQSNDSNCMNQSIFLSYSWANSSCADDIESSLSGIANVRRDKNDVSKWGSLSTFMKSIRSQDFVVMVISDAYLRSSACLFEVIQLMKEEDWTERAMYVVMDDARGVYNALKQADYITYWEKYCNDLEHQIKRIDPAATASLSEELRKSKEILHNIGEFMTVVKDANNPPVNEAISEIQKRLTMDDDFSLSKNGKQSTEMAANASVPDNTVVLELLKRNKENEIISLITNRQDGVSSREVAETLELSIRTVQRYLSSLVKRGVITVIGSNRGKKFYLTLN